MSEVNLTIDGQSVAVPKGTLIVEAARKLGIEIPVYCYHPKLDPVGACRVCVVNVENQRRPIMPACATEVAEGMVVHTRDKDATRAREGVIELLLINHPLDCPVCDRGGECDLQDFTLRYGAGKSRFEEEKRHFEKSKVVGREVVLDRERCIMCMRCVRFCDEVPIEEGLTIIERGTKAEIGPFPGRSFDSQFSGNTIEICPVGALTSRNYRFKSRPWELQNYASVCTHCSMGCNLTVDVRYYDVARLRSRCNDAIDDGWLCDKGRYGYEFVNRKERLLKPLLRREGKLVEVSWKEALEAAATGLKKAGSEAAAWAGPRLSNEAAWQMLRLLRSTLGSAHIDHRRGGDLKVPLHAKIEGIDSATAIVVAQADPTSKAPVLDLRVKKALRKGAELIVVGDCGLSGYADFRVASLEELRQALAALPEAEAPAIRHPKPRAWEPGGATSTEVVEAAKALQRSPRVTIIFDEAQPAAGLLELSDQIGCSAPHGLLMLQEGANSGGLRELGLLPDLPSELRKPLEEAWGQLSAGAGKDPRQAKALLLMAEDVCETKPDFLVVADLFLTEVAQKADVVLPACSWLEQAMTLTNLDGTVQLCRQAMPAKGESRPDWQILTLLAEALGQKWDTDSAAKIFAEIGKLHPNYAGASYASFQTEATQHWSYPQQGRIGTPRADLSAIPVRNPEATPWMPAVDTGSRVERVARLKSGDVPPAVPGQLDPREVASRLFWELPVRQADGVPVPRISPSQSPQPPGPSPAQRYHQVGMAVREEPQGGSLPC